MRCCLSAYKILRKILFILPPEFSHHFTLGLIKCLYPPWRTRKIRRKFPQNPREILGLHFPNPVGLAAGLDKNGDYIDALYGLGFGFIEVGAVTPRPQPGNPKPRLFRLPAAQALINQFGFNNRGVDHLVAQLKRRKVPGIIGVNIGKNFDTPLTEAHVDYAICLRKVYPYVDFVTLNISSPNTQQLRKLQGEEYLYDLLSRMKSLQHELQHEFNKVVPLFVKVSPDLTDEEIEISARIILETKIEGIIATNTTQDRSKVQGLQYADRPGGLSGKPLFDKTRHVVKSFARLTQNKVTIIAVGGIMSPNDARILLKQGAHLVQIYTGLIYEGPALLKAIVNQR